MELTAARRELDRAEAAFAKRAVSDFDLAKARDDVATAALRHRHAVQDAGLQAERLDFELEATLLDIKRQRLRVAEQIGVGELEIRSPVTGMVGNLLAADRDAVARDAPLLTVVDLTAFEVELQVPDAYGSILTPGLPASITHQGRAWMRRCPCRRSGEQPGHDRVPFSEGAGERTANQRVAARILLDGKAGVLGVDRGPFLESEGASPTCGRRLPIVTAFTGLVSVGRGDLERSRNG